MKKFALLLAILLLPLIGSVLGVNKLLSVTENRTLHQMPEFGFGKINDFPGLFSDYFSDNFGFRPFLLGLDSLVKYKLFKTSTNELVTLGQGGWLFYSSEQTYLDDIHSNQFSREELERINKNLSDINSYLKARGVKFYFLVGPKAQSVYPEYLPKEYKVMSGQTRLEQVEDYLGKNSPDLVFINPVKELKAQKSSHQVYFMYDTHWNHLGAFTAYQSLMSRVGKDFPDLTAQQLSDYQISYQPSRRNDLAILLGWSEILREREPILTPRSKPLSHQTSPLCEDIYSQCLEVTTQSSKGNLKALIYRDSFGTDLIPYLSEHFQKARYIWKLAPHPLEDIEQEKPDLVIYEITERNLDWLVNPLFR